MNARLLGRHGVSMLAALGVLLAMPALLAALLSGLGEIFGLRSGFTTYDASVKGPGPVGILLILAAVSGVCLLGQVARRRWRLLTWALPLIPGIGVGAWVAFMARGGDIPITWPMVLGLTAGIFVALLVGSYWFVLQLIPARRQR